MRFKDLTGKRFGRLMVVCRGTDCHDKNTNHVRATWDCICDCGNKVNVLGCNLSKGVSQSCGCLRKEISSARMTTHGMTKKSLYHIYNTMIARCHNPKSISYKDYGAKGIVVCEEWREKFETFMNWALSAGYEKGLSIERKDNYIGYCPQNCTWIPRNKQNRNKRNSHFVYYKGQKMCITELAEKTGLTRKVLYRNETRYNFNYDLLVEDYLKTHERIIKGGKLTWQKLKSQQAQP